MMEPTLNKLFNSYDYYIQPNKTYIKIGRELEYYSYDSDTCYAVVPLIDKSATYKSKIPHVDAIDFFKIHLENNKKYLYNI